MTNKKLNRYLIDKIDLVIPVILCLDIFISALFFLLINSGNFKIREIINKQVLEIDIGQKLSQIIQNQQETSDLISKLYLNQNNHISDLYFGIEEQSRVRGIALFENIKSQSKNIQIVKNLIVANTSDPDKNKDNLNRVVANSLVESDYLIQKLLDEGLYKYKEKNFTEAISVYNEILNIDSLNTKALCYYNTSLYKRNPGDSSNFYSIIYNLNSLIEMDVLNQEEKTAVFDVLLGISREEGNTDSIKKYLDALKHLQDD
jgi:tetratricopeptide (TPR) repeat protein